MREKIEEPEQWIAVDVVHILRSLGPQNTQGKLSNLLWWYALGLHLVNNGLKPSGIAVYMVALQPNLLVDTQKSVWQAPGRMTDTL